MVTDQIADLLTRIRNAQRAGHPSVLLPASRTKESVLSVLCTEGYVESFERIEESGNKAKLKVLLRYTERGEPAIKEIRRLSKPGRRRYVGRGDIPRFKGGLGTVVVSTPKGMLADRDARREGIGGELVCAVF